MSGYGQESKRSLKSHKHRVGHHRHHGDRLLADLIEVGLLPSQQRAAHRVDDVLVALGVDHPAVMQRVGVSGELGTPPAGAAARR